MGNFTDTITKKLAQFKRELDKAEREAVKKALQAATREYKAIAKPFIPVLGKSTPHRAKGTVQRNLRHRIKVKKGDDGYSGLSIIRIRRAGGKKMAPVSVNTKDKTDPFYWFMLDRGTKKMKGSHFMEKAKSAGEKKALNTVKSEYLRLMQQGMNKWK